MGYSIAINIPFIISFNFISYFNNTFSSIIFFKFNFIKTNEYKYAVIGDSYVELQDYESAIKYFKLASSENPNEYFTPKYLTKLALVYEKINDLNSALDCYEQIIDDFKDSPEYQISLKNKSRLEGLI